MLEAAANNTPSLKSVQDTDSCPLSQCSLRQRCSPWLHVCSFAMLLRESSGALSAHGASMVVKMIAAMGWWYLQWFYGLHPAIASMTGEGCCHFLLSKHSGIVPGQECAKMNVRIKIQFPMQSKARRFIISNLVNPFGKNKKDDSVKLVKETRWTEVASLRWEFLSPLPLCWVPPVASKDSADLIDLERVFFSSSYLHI